MRINKKLSDDAQNVNTKKHQYLDSILSTMNQNRSVNPNLEGLGEKLLVDVLLSLRER